MGGGGLRCRDLERAGKNAAYARITKMANFLDSFLERRVNITETLFAESQ